MDFQKIRSGHLDFAGMLSYLLKVYTSVSVRETTVIRNACTMTAVCFIERLHSNPIEVVWNEPKRNLYMLKTMDRARATTIHLILEF